MSKSKEVNVKRSENVKRKVSDSVSTVSRVVRNAEQLVQAVSLLGLSAFAYTQLKTVQNDVLYYTVAFFLAVVGIRATYEFLRFLAKDK